MRSKAPELNQIGQCDRCPDVRDGYTAASRGRGYIVVRQMIRERGRDNMLRSLRQRTDELCSPRFIISREAYC